MIVDVKISDNLQERRTEIMKKQITKTVAKGMKTALDVILRAEANSTSCMLAYQPKEPNDLKKFRRNK